MVRHQLSLATLRLLFIAALIFHHHITSVSAIFIQPPTTKIPYPSLQLAFANEQRIPYEGFAYDAGKEASLPSFALSLDAEFGELDAITFLCLMDAYGSWSETKSKVKWVERESYTLIDFLPPLCQAVNGLYFRSSKKKLAGLPSFIGGPNDMVKKLTEQEVLLTTNCWGFAWEVLYQADNADVSNMQISTADPQSAWRAFTNPQFFELVQSSRGNSKILTDPAVRNKRLKTGDTLLVWHRIPGQSLYLDHVAILIDDDVYYEKSGSGDKVPFRLTTWEGVTANFPASIFYWEWRRLIRNRTVQGVKKSSSKLKSAKETFSVGTQVKRGIFPEKFNVLSELRPRVSSNLSLQIAKGDDGEEIEGNMFTGILVLEDLVYDQMGRASLPMSAFTDVMLPQLPERTYKKRRPKQPDDSQDQSQQLPLL